MSIPRTPFVVAGVSVAIVASAGANGFNMGPGPTSLEFVTVGDPGSRGDGRQRRPAMGLWRRISDRNWSRDRASRNGSRSQQRKV